MGNRLSYYDLFAKIVEVWREQAYQKLRIVTKEWRLKPNFEENILASLLLLHQDKSAW
jgi:hypothetical protein